MHVIIAGGGSLGISLCKHLSPAHDVVLIVAERPLAERLRAELDVQVICGSAASLAVLQVAKASQAYLFVAITGIDEVNLVSCIMAKRLGVKFTAAFLSQQPKLLEPEIQSIDYFLNPYQQSAWQVAQAIFFPIVKKTWQFAGGAVWLSYVPVSEHSPLLGQEISNIKLPYMAKVTAVYRADRQVYPGSSDVLKSGDHVYFIQEPSHNAWVPPRSISRGIILAGCGETGLYLAQMLERTKISLRIIDCSLERCISLSETLKHQPVYCGDVTDHRFLSGIIKGNTDVFIAATGNDLTNLLTLLLAKGHGIQQTIGFVRDASCKQAMEAALINHVIAPAELIAEAVSSLLSQNGIVSIFDLHHGNVKAIEFTIPTDGSIPAEGVVAAVIRVGRLTGEGSQILPGDRVLMLLSAGRSRVLSDTLLGHRFRSGKQGFGGERYRI